MYSEEIERVLTEYLNNAKTEYAVMIDGDWGTGKTYFLTHSLMKIIESIDIGKGKRRKYAYVSLYGAKSFEDISKEILFQYFGKKNKKGAEKANTVIETASNILTASLGVVNIDLSKIGKMIKEIDIKDWIICFDDLERCCISINEVLGYLNRLVEHNNCKIIVLANEKEIGKISLTQRLEEKYQVVLSGKKLMFEKGDNLCGNNSSGNNKKEEIDIKELQRETQILFDEDILYKVIREKVIGLTIKYEPQMNVVYDSIISDYCDGTNFKKYLIKKKEKILKYFEDEECYNLRTLICVLGSIQKVYEEMYSQKFDTIQFFDEIMDSFLKYIVLLTIYYKNGGRISELGLSTEIGYVSLGQSIYSRTKGFKFLERYCTTLSFSEEEFIRVVSMLRQEYEEAEEEKERLKIGYAKAYGELYNWWEKEDDEVSALIKQLKDEVDQDKYVFSNYQGIIGQLMVLEYWGHEIGNMDELINIMNRNIEKSKEIVDIERQSFSFENNPELRKRYDEYVDMLKLRAGNKNQTIKTNEVAQYLNSENWTELLADYCDKHMNEFYCRYGFIDLLDLDVLVRKIRNASAKELLQLRDILKTVYKVTNINVFFVNDLPKVRKLREEIKQINVTGINRNLAKGSLEDYLGDVINRLEGDTNN